MDKDKGKKLNDGIFDILLGSMIMTGANFTGGMLLEKINEDRINHARNQLIV